MTVWQLLNNPVTTLAFMASIGVAALMVGIGKLIDLRDMPHVEPNVGDE